MVLRQSLYLKYKSWDEYVGSGTYYGPVRRSIVTDVILITPPYRDIIYKHTKVKVGVPVNPLLNLALLAAVVTEAGFKVKILDLNVVNNPDIILKREISREVPRIVGITFTTPLYSEARRLAKIIKELSQHTLIIAGGPRVSVFPEDTLRDSLFDIAAIGEADFVIKDILELPLEQVEGIIFKRGTTLIKNKERQQIQNLDLLPFPAWNLYNLRKYDRLSLSNQDAPPGYLETSRGCPGDCVFCYRIIQKKKFRPKSARRVVDEIEYMLKVGFREINILDDNFSTDLNRAKLICEEIIKRGIKFFWHSTNGIRVDTVDRELLFMMKKSGCYRVAFGIESGNQDVLDKINKGIKLSQAEQAVKLAKLEGLETFGFFVLGLPPDTEKTMRDTINFAKKLKLDLAQFTIVVPYPGTRIFKEWKEKGYIRTYDWIKYNFNSPYGQIYTHPNLSHNVLNKYFKKAYRSFYLDPLFIWRRFVKGIRKKVILKDIRFFLQTNWFN